mgnify:CR=1 FL=1
MIEIPYAPLERRKSNAHRRALPPNFNRCIACNAPLKSLPGIMTIGLWVHLGQGGSMLLAAGERSPNGQDEDGAGGQGMFPIGPECAKKLPREYVFAI